ncbi:class E sortase [Dietzia lutea]|uniref:Class E sortase n=1 Tax=Dietzia lutea TaxID=546160 RepID=A0A2S1R4K0_9ACTN|nr:class E sortase [Dietzia lutea]AWH91230.1 class E sortase [Dietzia lutea]
MIEPVTTGSTPRRAPTIGQVAGELLLTVGALLLLFVVYEAFWTNLAAGRLQDEAAAELDRRWDDSPVATSEPVPPKVPQLGHAFARVHLPTLGPDATYAVVEGTRNEDLRTGPGHYVDTQMPGEPGNFALAGHRNGSGAVFERLDQLDSCDAVVIETETQWMTYRLLPVEADGPQRRDTAQDCLTPQQVERVTTGDYSHVRGRHITTPDAVEMIAPVPGAAGTPEAPERLVTLTTCHPMYSNAERLIVHAVLTETTAKADGRPAALED